MPRNPEDESRGLLETEKASIASEFARGAGDEVLHNLPVVRRGVEVLARASKRRLERDVASFLADLAATLAAGDEAETLVRLENALEKPHLVVAMDEAFRRFRDTLDEDVRPCLAVLLAQELRAELPSRYFRRTADLLADAEAADLHAIGLVAEGIRELTDGSTEDGLWGFCVAQTDANDPKGVRCWVAARVGAPEDGGWKHSANWPRKRWQTVEQVLEKHGFAHRITGFTFDVPNPSDDARGCGWLQLPEAAVRGAWLHLRECLRPLLLTSS